MTLYFSEKHINNDISLHLRKIFPRGEISSNRLNIRRADTIDYNLLLKNFECAVVKTKNMYNVAITLPTDMEYRIPSLIVKGEGEIWVNPKPDLKGKNSENKENFVTEFHFYLNEKKVLKTPETMDIPIQEVILGEFIEIRHALINGNEEPIDIFRKYYANGSEFKPKSTVARYLDSVLKQSE